MTFPKRTVTGSSIPHGVACKRDPPGAGRFRHCLSVSLRKDSPDDLTEIQRYRGYTLARHQMRRITRRKDPTGKTHPLYALICDQRVQRRALGRYRAWLQARA